MRPIVAHEVHKWDRRERRAHSVGNSIIGTKERPRLSIYRSNKHFHSQLIDDTEGKTLALEGRVRGEEISFSAGGKEYKGKLNGKTLELQTFAARGLRG